MMKTFTKKYLPLLLLAVLFFFFSLKAQSQEETKKEESLIQFSGLILTADSMMPIPYATVKVLNSPRGTIANFQGFFTIPVNEDDTIQFSAVGFKKSKFSIPKGLRENKLKIIQTLEFDTITFKETVVYPWPTPEHFKQAFLDLRFGDDDFNRAMKNLEEKNMDAIASNMGMDARENARYAIQQQIARTYYAGGQKPYFILNGGEGTPIPGTLFNPFSWAELIKSIKRGDFKKKAVEYNYPND